ncbi:MAG: MqnA/MqnD/SBP family protein [Vampirovibrionales bacterium]
MTMSEFEHSLLFPPKGEPDEILTPDVGFPDTLEVGYFDFLNCLPVYWDMLKLRTTTEHQRASMAVSLQEQLHKQRFTRPVEQTLFRGMQVHWSHGTPSQLNKKVLAGELALSPVSSLVYLKNQSTLTLWQELGIASQRDQVLSVTLYTQVPPIQFKPGMRVLVPDASETSIALLECMLCRMIAPSTKWRDGFEVYPHGQGMAHVLQEEDKTPILMIGDEAFAAYKWIERQKPRTGASRYVGISSNPTKPSAWNPLDLASLWYAQTKLPFVFGVWVSPTTLSAEEHHATKTVVHALAQSYQQWRVLSKEQQRLLVRDALLHRGMNPELTDDTMAYLNDMLTYSLSTQHMTSLELFARELKKLGYIP